MNGPVLVTISEAIKPYRGVSIKMVRAWIRRGELAAVRAGRNYLIDPRDLANRLTPRLQTPKAPKKRETQTERIERQLRNAGIDVGRQRG